MSQKYLFVEKKNIKSEKDDFDLEEYENKYIFHGQFTQKSKKMIVSDPCYEYNVNDKKTYYHIFDNVKRGSWNVWTMHWDNDTICELVAIYCPFNISKNPEATDYHFTFRDWKNIGTVFVDSGQLGIYDLKNYRDDKNVGSYDIWNKYKIQNEGDKWYAMNCQKTLSKPYAGIINNGCVASPCFGDGIYNVEILKFQGQINGIRIIFDDALIDSDED